MANAELMRPFFYKWEGGYVNDPRDRGGATNKGITIAVFRHYYGQDKTVEDLKKITDEQWMHIFKTGYYDKVKGDYIKNQSLALLCVDMCWGSGSITAIRRIQRCLGLEEDGIVGNHTLNALNNDPKMAFNRLWIMRKVWLESISKVGKNSVFLKGWLRRLNDIKYQENA